MENLSSRGILKLDTRSKAEELASALLEVDAISSVPIPASAKRYARMRSSILFKDHGQAKEKLYLKQVADTTNQQGKTKGFKNYDGSAYTGRKKSAHMEGGVKDFLRKHGISRTREIRVKRDSNDANYLAVPVYDNVAPGNWTNLFNLSTAGANPKQKFKERLTFLVRNRKGYRPGDVFVSELGRFLVTDVLGIKEI